MPYQKQEKTDSENPINGAPTRRFVNLTDLSPSHALPNHEQEGFSRRFSTLFLDESRNRNGGLGKVYFATNPIGESFAIKVLASNDPDESSKIGAIDSAAKIPNKDDQFSRHDFLTEAFEQEYETQRLSSGIKGFPKLYGKGKWDGQPAIIMEWIEGETLAKARLRLSVDNQGRLSPLTAAMIGMNLFDLLSRMNILNDELVHRDISPSNIMISTSTASAEEQARNGTFDLKLIDFGSAELVARDSSITERFSAPRGATPDFASPEMLTEDAPNIAALRKSAAIDVYAAGSALYQLLTGHAPFDLSQKGPKGERLSPYRIKLECSPMPPVLAHHKVCDFEKVLVNEPQTLAAAKEAMASIEKPVTQEQMRAAMNAVDNQLGEIVLACLNPIQEERPNAADVKEALSAFVANYNVNLKRALDGEALLPVSQKSLRSKLRPSKPKRSKIQIALQSITVLIALASITSCAALLDNIPIGFNVFGAFHQWMLNGFVVAAILLLPPVLGALFRWRNMHGRAGFIRATIGVAFGVALVLGAALLATFVTQSFEQLFIGAALVSGTCSWLFFVADFVFVQSSKQRSG